MTHTIRLTSGNHAQHSSDFSDGINFIVGGFALLVPASDVREVAAKMIRDKMISDIEGMDADEILNLPKLT